jgi:hypothetical protein
MIIKHIIIISVAAVFLLEKVLALRVAVISDVHIYPVYDPAENNTCYCTTGCPSTQDLSPERETNWFAPLGRMFCDPPMLLTESFL